MERFPPVRSAAFNPPRMMYDAAVAIGFAPRTSLSQKSNLREDGRATPSPCVPPSCSGLVLLLTGVRRQLAGIGFGSRLVKYVFAWPDEAQPLARLFLDGAGIGLLQAVHLVL